MCLIYNFSAILNKKNLTYSVTTGFLSIPMKFFDPGRNEKGAVIAGMAG